MNLGNILSQVPLTKIIVLSSSAISLHFEDLLFKHIVSLLLSILK